MNIKIKENLKKTLFFSMFVVLGFVFLLSLVSASSEDNTFLKFDSEFDGSSNILGYFGSIFSNFLLDIFGIASYIFCLFFFSHAIRTLTSRESKWYAWNLLPLTIILLCFSIEFIKTNYFSISLESGILGIGLNFYFNHYFGDLTYLNYLFLVICIVLFLSVLITFNINLNDLIKFLMFLLKSVLQVALYLVRFISLNRLKFNQSIFDQKKRTYSSKAYSSVRKEVKSNTIRRVTQDYIFPSIDLLEREKKIPGIEAENKKNAELNRSLLSGVLRDFKISGEITNVRQGPIVTLFELTPAPGTLSSSVIRLSDDIARSMSAKSTRISTIPGRDAIGIEIPNKQRHTVFLRELLNDQLFKNNKFKLPLALGKDIFGKPVVVDLAKMPHLLVAGTTGSGKSVGINAMLLSLLYYLPPEECRLILIDPKMLELSIYQDIPHLLTEVVTDPKQAIAALKWTVKEMEKRYQMMTHLEVREIDDYNRKVKKILQDGHVVFKEMQVGYDSESGKPVIEKKALDLEIFPKIVVVVDELADLMITSGKEIEGAIQRLSQMARAAGIHLIVATQRPSVDVITGTIKSNFPTRISYKVVNKINSRTILEEQGAEQLLGQGDLLITMLGESLLRVHGPFVKTEEVQSVVNHLKKQGEPEYLNSITKTDEEQDNYNLGFDESVDELYDKAVSIVCREKKASTSFIQRHLQIGYNRAARIIEKMESEGIVSPANHVGRREVLVGKDH